MTELLDADVMLAIKGLIIILIVELGIILKAISAKSVALLTEKKNAISTQTLVDYGCIVEGQIQNAVLEAEQTIVPKKKQESGNDYLSPTEQESVRNSVIEIVKSNTPNNVIATLEQNGIDFTTLVKTGIEKTIIKLNEKSGGR